MDIQPRVIQLDVYANYKPHRHMTRWNGATQSVVGRIRYGQPRAWLTRNDLARQRYGWLDLSCITLPRVPNLYFILCLYILLFNASTRWTIIINVGWTSKTPAIFQTDETTIKPRDKIKIQKKRMRRTQSKAQKVPNYLWPLMPIEGTLSISSNLFQTFIV